MTFGFGDKDLMPVMLSPMIMGLLFLEIYLLERKDKPNKESTLPKTVKNFRRVIFMNDIYN